MLWYKPNNWLKCVVSKSQRLQRLLPFDSFDLSSGKKCAVPVSKDPVVYLCNNNNNKYLGNSGMKTAWPMLTLIWAQTLPCFLFLEAVWGMQPHTHTVYTRTHTDTTAEQPDSMCHSLLKANGWTKHMLLSSRTIQSDVSLPYVKSGAALCLNIPILLLLKCATIALTIQFAVGDLFKLTALVHTPCKRHRPWVRQPSLSNTWWEYKVLWYEYRLWMWMGLQVTDSE